MPKKSFYVKDSELDEYQLQVIQRRTNKSFIVKGCAGSGKSILALWKVKQIQEQNLGSYYLIVYTKTLKQFMKDGIREIGLNNDKVLYYEQWKRLGNPSANFIVVDEAQDFTQEQIEGFKRSATTALILYGDSAQQIYKFRTPPPISMERIIDITGFQSEQLVFNHRLPKKIARIAQYITETDDELEMRCKNEGSELPKILKYNDLNGQLDAIAQIISNRKFVDVGIFFPKNEKVEYAFNYLSKKGLNVEAKFDRDMTTTLTLNFGNENPKIVTYHSAKVLQFEAVFIPNCNVEENDKRNALYVAITRSYQSLFIMHSGDLSSFFDEVPKNLYETSLSTQGGIRL